MKCKNLADDFPRWTFSSRSVIRDQINCEDWGGQGECPKKDKTKWRITPFCWDIDICKKN